MQAIMQVIWKPLGILKACTTDIIVEAIWKPLDLLKACTTDIIIEIIIEVIWKSWHC